MPKPKIKTIKAFAVAFIDDADEWHLANDGDAPAGGKYIIGWDGDVINDEKDRLNGKYNTNKYFLADIKIGLE